MSKKKKYGLIFCSGPRSLETGLVELEEANLTETLNMDGREVSKNLIPAVFGILKNKGIGLEDLGFLSFYRDLGSLTGLRVLAATLKGIGKVSGARIIGVSRFEVICPTPHPKVKTLLVLPHSRSGVAISILNPKETWKEFRSYRVISEKDLPEYIRRGNFKQVVLHLSLRYLARTLQGVPKIEQIKIASDNEIDSLIKISLMYYFNQKRNQNDPIYPETENRG